jgi:hypothetical protein
VMPLGERMEALDRTGLSPQIKHLVTNENPRRLLDLPAA